MHILQSVLGNSDTGPQVTSAETIERLVDRVNTSTLLEDRRDACRALKAMSRKFRYNNNSGLNYDNLTFPLQIRGWCSGTKQPCECVEHRCE